MLFNYQNLSLKSLNLFAELFYLSNNSISNEFAFDNFTYLTVKNSNDTNQFYNQGLILMFISE
jgi:hypothetical protein